MKAKEFIEFIQVRGLEEFVIEFTDGDENVFYTDVEEIEVNYTMNTVTLFPG